MNLLPVVQRELRVASRKAMTYYSRSIAGLIAACISLGIILIDFSGTIAAGSSGEHVFHILSGIAYFFVCFEGALLTCDCLSAEKREGTLGLLFLTDLRGYDIVAGKLIPHTSRTLLYVIAALPASAIAFILGGITGSELVSMAVALINALFFSAAIGLVVSAFCWHDRHAIIFGVGSAMLLTMAVPAIELFGLTVPGSLVGFGPAGAFLVALDVGSATMPGGVYSTSIIDSQIIGWACIAVASYVVSRSIKSEAVGLRSGRKLGVSAEHRNLHPEISDFNFLPPTKADWVGAIMFPTITLIVFMVIRRIYPFTWSEIPMLMSLIVIVHLVLKFIVTGRACRVLVHTRQKGELEMLLTTPFDTHDILRGYALGIKRQLIPLVAGVVCADVAMLVAACATLRFFDGFCLFVVFVAEWLWLFLNLYSLTWVGMYMSLRSRSVILAVQWTLGLVLLGPWIVIFLTVGLVALASTGAVFRGGLVFMPALWALGLVLFSNLAVTAWVMNDIHDRFRELAAHQVIPQAGRPRWSWRHWVRRFFLLER